MSTADAAVERPCRVSVEPARPYADLRPEEVVITALAEQEGRPLDEIRNDLDAVAFWTTS